MRQAVRPLVLTWLALLVLLSVSAGTAMLPLGWINTAIGLTVALVKALLVALVFMRLRGGAALLRLAVLAGVVTLALLFGLSGADYATRPAAPAQWQQPATVAPRLGSGWGGLRGGTKQSRRACVATGTGSTGLGARPRRPRGLDPASP